MKDVNEFVESTNKVVSEITEEKEVITERKADELSDEEMTDLQMEIASSATSTVRNAVEKIIEKEAKKIGKQFNIDPTRDTFRSEQFGSVTIEGLLRYQLAGEIQ